MSTSSSAIMALQALPPPSDGTALAVQGKVQFLLPVIEDLVLDDDSRYDSDAEAFFQALLVLLLLLTFLTLLLLLLCLLICASACEHSPP